MGLFSSGGYNTALKNLEKQKSAATSYYLRQAYENPLDNSANAAALRQAREIFSDNAKRARNYAAVTGATDAAMVSQRAAGNKAIENAMSNIAAEGTRRKDAAMENYMKAAQSYDSQITNVQMQKEKENTSAISGLLSTAASIVGTIYGGPAGGAIAGSAVGAAANAVL
jgi:hypothetical protein